MMDGDLISRQAAMDALHTWFRDGFEEDKWWNSTHVLAALEGVPSAQPERKKGRWIKSINPGYSPFDHSGEYIGTCSECGHKVNLVDGGMYRFCSACGARMEGEE